MLLEGQLPKKDVDRIAHALGLVVGTEAVIALTDAVGLDYPMAKKMLLDASRWLLSGALAELTNWPRRVSRQASIARKMEAGGDERRIVALSRRTGAP